MAVKLGSTIRALSPESTYFGPRFSATAVPSLALDRKLVLVSNVIATIAHTEPDSSIAKYCAAVVREYHEDGCEENGKQMIVCTSLLETGHAGPDGNIPPLMRVFELHSEELHMKWLER